MRGSIYVIITETDGELCCLIKEEEEEEGEREFKRFAYKACTGLFSYVKHTNC